MNTGKRICIAIILILSLIFSNPYLVRADIKPNKPIAILEKADNSSIQIIIPPTMGAEGYRVYLKGPHDTKYKKVKTIKEDGSERRVATVSKLDYGEYSVKVRAYKKNSKKTVLSAYSKAKTISLNREPVNVDSSVYEKALDEYVSANYPSLKKMKDEGKIGLKGDFKRDTIIFGRYDLQGFYDIPEADKKDVPLEWEVLQYSEDGKSALVISKYIICRRSYWDGFRYWLENIDYPFVEGQLHTWENSGIRKYLNNNFYRDAFSESERKRIRLTEIVNECNDDYGTFFGSYSGRNTKDYIFLLSMYEIETYFKSEGRKKLYANTRSATMYDGSMHSWWTRTPGAAEDKITYVDYDGSINTKGDETNQRGIRPAFWISLTPEIIKKNNLSIGKDYVPEVSDVYVVMGKYDKEKWDWFSVLPNVLSDGVLDELEWKILKTDTDTNSVLLLSKDIIGFYGPYREPEWLVWEKNPLREWLNNEFFNQAFSNKEKELVLKSLIKNEDVLYDGPFGSPIITSNTDDDGNKRSMLVKGGKDTTDKVFLLSVAEIYEYYTVPDEYDHTSNLELIGRTYDGYPERWQLRSGACVLTDGSGINAYNSFYYGLRPAFWMKID